jgi:carboxyl-terminal processing protease
MSPKTLTWIILFATVLAGSFRMRFVGRDADELALEQATYENVRSLINERYVKALTAEERQEVFYGALRGMTSSLDKHSQFLSPESYDHQSTLTQGRFAGIGIEIVDEPRKNTVLTPLLGSPAYNAGVLPDDHIVKINGEVIEGLSQDEREMRIKGPLDTPVTLTIERESLEKPADGSKPRRIVQTLDISMRRAIIQVKSIQAEEILGEKFVARGKPKIGYIQIGIFQQNTADELDAALKRLEAQGMTALILDLRQNTGGLLDEAEQVGSLFFKDGPIVTLQYRDPARLDTRSAIKGRTHPEYPMAILVDSHSASASEIVAGALHDRNRTVLVGDRTYGKFSVQEVIPVPLGRRDINPATSGSVPGFRARQEKIGALKLTIAKYKTPKSECIDGQGFVPDFPVPSTPEMLKGLMDSRKRRHLRLNDPAAKNGKPLKADDDPFDDVQLKKAVEVLQEKEGAAKQ